ncbi:transport and Golgi organization protein 6 homolog [Macrobrachium nipponense]|uniref:transport and Golgi organization protein 6 homolog n=1 Tax=Macrobrachium nipponense TaxID=159736 RepID=UPI0030C7BD18
MKLCLFVLVQILFCFFVLFCRFLSQQSPLEAIRILLHVCRVNLLPEIPTVNPHILLCLDDEGGVRLDVAESVCQQKVLENDEHLAKVVVKILEELQNPEIVRAFYESLVSYIDFSVLNRKETSSTLLVTDCDVRVEQFEAVRRIYICCSLLSNLADNGKLTDDLFQNLSAAVPIVVSLLKTCCQKCEDEALDKTRLSFMLHVVMMVSCYVSEQILRKRMSSEDWKGLKLLLPSLVEIKNTVTDEAVLMFVEQLRNTVITHGAITHTSNKSDQAATIKDPHSSNQTSSKSAHGKGSNPVNMVKTGSESLHKRSSYSEAMEDVVSPILPTRGHGLLILSKLIEERDDETLLHKEQLLALFQHSLKEEDSYIYLMAVQGLAVLCDAFPEKVIDILTREFAVGNRTPEDRAKLAEALVRASRRLGPILPHHKSHFINCLLSGLILI